MIDWPRAVRIALRHRVEGFVADGLDAAGVVPPPEVKAVLHKAATAIAIQNLRFAAETGRLARLAGEAGLDMLVMKGVSLNVLAFGGLAIKKAWDIDLLVSPDDVDAARSMLEAAGYLWHLPVADLTPEQARRWLLLSKESLWFHKESGIAVELHTALTDNRVLLAGVSLDSPRQRVAIRPGQEVETLADAELVAYLCVHGTTHGWARLKWLVDLNALLGIRPATEVERLYRQAVALGAGRAPGQALLLCHDLLDLELTPELERELRSQPAIRWLVRTAKNLMGVSHVEKEVDDSVFGTASIQLSHFFMASGLRHKLAEARQKINLPYGPVFMPLPRYLRFAYPIMAVPHWLWRRYKLRRDRMGSRT
jgi:hypothetical protein